MTLPSVAFPDVEGETLRKERGEGCALQEQSQ